MKRFSQQFKKQTERISLKASERHELKARVLSYIEYHPLPHDVKKGAGSSLSKIPTGAIASDPFFTISIHSLSFKSFAGVFAVFFFVGIPFIAEQSLPGDVLYPIKVQFNEELRSSLSFSPYAKVEWETERLGRRVAEARLLASEGKLTQEAEASFAEAVKTHTDAAQREIAEIKANDKDAAAIAEITFASALAVQSQVLENSQGKQDGGNSVLALAEVVAQARTTAEASQTEAPSYTTLLAAVESESTHVYELFTSVKSSASTEEIADVERRLADIERKRHIAVAYKEGTVIEDQVIASRATTITIASKKEGAVEILAEEATTSVATSTDTVTLALSADFSTAETASLNDDTLLTIETPSVRTEVDAVTVLTGALTDIQKLLSYLTDINVRENVSIDELVPLTPTAEENVQETMRLFDQALAIQNALYSKNVSQKVREKATQGQKDLDTILAEITHTMRKGNVDEALTLAREASVIAKDLELLTIQDPTTMTLTEEVLGTSTDAVTEE